MRIFAIFGVYQGEGQPELLDAWDEWSVDSNPDGYAEKLAKFKETPHIENVTEVTIEVDSKAILKAVMPQHPTIKAEVVEN